MHKLCFFVPVEHTEAVKRAVFAAGAGRIGEYDCCSWQVLGEGQFRPCEGASPFIGEHGQLTRVPEYKVEMVVADEHVAAAVAALRTAHPYEEPAFEVWRLADVPAR